MDLKSLVDSVTTKQQYAADLKMKIKVQEQAVSFLDTEILDQKEKETRLSVQIHNLITENNKYDEKIPLAQRELDVAKESCSAQQHSAAFMIEKLNKVTVQLDEHKKINAQNFQDFQQKCSTQLTLLESLSILPNA